MKKKKEETTLIRRNNKHDSQVKVQKIQKKIPTIQISSSAGVKKASPKN